MFFSILLAEVSAAKLAVGWIVVLIGVSLGAVAICFPSERKLPDPDQEAERQAKLKKKKK